MEVPILIFLTLFTFSHAYPPALKNLDFRLVGNEIEIEDVIFQVYNKGNSQSGTRIQVGNTDTLASSGFDSSKLTKIITHGFLDDMVGHVEAFKTAFLSVDDLNIILVDWSKCSKDIRYEIAVECSKQVGNYIGNLLLFLNQETGLDYKDVHLIGHSLGAEALAFVSEVLPQKVGRISGMDPAGPLFEHEGPSERLDSEDADFVDVIHTCGIFYGIKQPVGTVDFYPNGGDNQPGCGSAFNIDCNHGAAHEYYRNTIYQSGRNEYIAAKCESYEDARNQTCSGEPVGIMGYDAIKTPPGIYYLAVTEPPKK